jgi:hypothetical protein
VAPITTGPQYHSTVRPKSTGKATVRVTLDLEPEMHRKLKRFAVDQPEISNIAEVMRAGIQLILNDEAVAIKVGLQLYRQRLSAAALSRSAIRPAASPVMTVPAGG